MRPEANRGTPLDMRTIDIFVSSPADVQKERAVAEQLIRSVAAEFNLRIKVSYSNRLRGSKAENEISVEREDFGDESTLVLCPCIWEYPELEGDEFLEQIPNTGQYDLVICILWSRLGTALVQKCAMPDGSRPGSATEYEVAWVLDQSKRTPGFPGLHVYRNRATPAAPLEPKEKRENLCRQWDAVQEFCAAWEKNGGTEFRECCHDYQDLEEFENLFREHFRDFLARQLDRENGLKKALRKVRYLKSNPFRGLNFFDFEHAAIYHGRTKAAGEVLDALKNQATAKKRFLLVMGPTGSGKSSLVRAGVLPLLTVGNGPWRRAVTRPGAGGGAGDPFDRLAAALLGEFALPELQDEESPDEWRTLASQLRKNPDDAAAGIAKVLDQLTPQELDLPIITLAPRFEYSRAVVTPKRLGRVKPKMRLALVVDQLEELFTGVSPELQRKYIAALGALANCEGVFTIATLRSDFYAHCQQFPELVELTALSGRYELQPPTRRGIGNMIRFPAEAAGLRFDRDPDTNRSLDEALLEAAIASPEPLPLLEHLLSRLYLIQLDRKDGLLLWSDYRGLGELQDALAHHAETDGLLLWSDYRGLGELQDALAQHTETVFLTLKREEQQALEFVIRHLVAPSRGEERPLIRRTVPYRDLVSSPELDQQQRAGAKGLVDRLIKEELLSADADPKQELLISVPQEALLRKWPGVWQWLSEDRHFFRMRDRLDASLELWLSRDRQSDGLLDRGIGLAEAEILLRDFGSSLSERQIDYIQKSLARQKRRRRVRDNIGLAALAGLAVFAAVAVVERLNTESQRKNRGQDFQLAQQNADLATSQRSALETQLKKAQEEKAQIAQQSQQIADLASSQRSALETQLKKTEEKAQLAQQNANLATSQRSALETQLKKAQEAKALAQQNADLATSQRSALETQLKKAEEKAQLAQKNTDLATSQRSALETQLKKAEEKAQLAQQNADLASSQRSALETQLKKAEEKAQLAQQNTDLATSQRSALETQLKKAQEAKALAQQNADLATSQRSALETQLKKAEEKAQLAQKNTDLTTSQRSALETQLKKAQEDKALAQQNADLVTSQRSALETQLKKAEEKAQLAQQNADLATSQRGALETQLKKAQEEKAQLAQQNTDLSSSQRTALETELKKAEEKAQLAQQNADLATSQRSTLETQLKKAEEKAQLAQQNADLVTSQRSALETQLKKAQEEKAQIAQQNTDLAASQRSALETQLKNDQVKLQQVQANAARQLSELEAQLRQEQERAQKAQANADFATSELRGIRLVERVTTPLRARKIQPATNDRNSDSRIGTDATFAWFMIGVNPEEKQTGLQWGKYARVNPAQDVYPIPSPSPKESETSNPPESQFDRSAEASGEEEFLKEFVLGYLRTVASNDTSMQRRYFAERVNFYGRGVLNSSNVEASTQHYHDEWPIREWAPSGEAKVVRSSNPNLFVVYQPFNWTVSDGSRTARGNATLYLRIRKNSQGEFRIVHVHQLER
jgi:Novel STAND NTPase 1